MGDLVFADGYIGRSDFAYSNYRQLIKSIKKILKLPDDTNVYCGHGPATSVSQLKLLQADII
ncbi:hypothetical protein A2154_00980 [Candidatus Gottesmanbacteria bacterium RBG_16_43_7]|uniref:Metallo-beta-lactamase domain-containing protein n=1 Tax=Candidatus Gottesmanbacteria bacterium RBG_16_43_7 TaxID=1798373 RepID=A0A1F5Z7Y4_9BACT|nr:MAG: hypothetical protein A2154_00980 [Candidatus Gottesmanbacteria bacterium RBG_16_43_7]